VARFPALFPLTKPHHQQYQRPVSRTAALLHALPDAVIGVDDAGAIVLWNAGAARLFRVPEEAALGQAALAVCGALASGYLRRTPAGVAVDAVAEAVDFGAVDVDGRALARVYVVRPASGPAPSASAPPAAPAPTPSLLSGEPLPPRLADTLQGLLAGRSEKEIASDLSLSPHTVHDYVKSLYRRFGVQSRAELMAKAIGQRPRDPQP
jgi:hypothetical protein